MLELQSAGLESHCPGCSNFVPVAEVYYSTPSSSCRELFKLDNLILSNTVKGFKQISIHFHNFNNSRN